MEQHERIRWQHISEGNAQAFEQLFREHYAALCQFARRFVPDEAQAEELVQDMFVALWEKRTTILPALSVRSYLFAAVRNACLNHIKHMGVRQQHQDHAMAAPQEVADDPEAAMQAAELEARISLAIDSLPDRCGEIFRLSRFEGKKYQEIADALGLSPRTVEVQIGKALRILRTQLEEFLPLWALLWIMEEWL